MWGFVKAEEMYDSLVCIVRVSYSACIRVVTMYLYLILA